MTASTVVRRLRRASRARPVSGLRTGRRAPRRPLPRQALLAQGSDEPKARKKVRAPTAQEISAFGRLSQAAVEGVRTGAQIAKATPRLGPVVGGIAGGVVGVVREADTKVTADAGVIEAEIVEDEQSSNPFAAAEARFGTASAGSSAPPKSSARTSCPFQYEEERQSCDSPQFE
ncbi:hypothetical protein [Arthrobacter sp. efr-133-TYG-118]|uniref:hypothetical protein n=1 Tax=Arthrobacter sp. efr-133-TYG-118 TaxID=3040279 RepID=UPI00254AE31F|nr:hypothetical protein [Arthrobacter sp. efr-133-TYG-118]